MISVISIIVVSALFLKDQTEPQLTKIGGEHQYEDVQVIRMPALSFPKPDGIWGCKFYRTCLMNPGELILVI